MRKNAHCIISHTGSVTDLVVDLLPQGHLHLLGSLRRHQAGRREDPLLQKRQHGYMQTLTCLVPDQNLAMHVS